MLCYSDGTDNNMTVFKDPYMNLNKVAITRKPSEGYMRQCRHLANALEVWQGKFWKKNQTYSQTWSESNDPLWRYSHLNFPRWQPRRHLGFDPTRNSTNWSADPETPSLEPNMEWIGCTICNIFAFKLYCDLKKWFGVIQGHWKWRYLIEHIRLYIHYSSSVVNTCMPLSITVSEI